MLRALAPFLACALLTGCGIGMVGVSTGENQRTPLEKAAQAGELAEVRRLLASGADPNGRGATGSALTAAVLRPHNTEIIRAIIAAGGNPDGRGQVGNTCWSTPLQLAAASGDVENTGAVLDAGAVMSKSGCSYLVAGWLQPPVIDLLVRHGFDLFATDKRGRNQLHLALAPPGQPRFEAVEYLVRAGVPLNDRDREGKMPMAYWREPRDFEAHWLRYWIFERLTGERKIRFQRENRGRITALLDRSGARL